MASDGNANWCPCGTPRHVNAFGFGKEVRQVQWIAGLQLLGRDPAPRSSVQDNLVHYNLALVLELGGYWWNKSKRGSLSDLARWDGMWIMQKRPIQAAVRYQSRDELARHRYANCFIDFEDNKNYSLGKQKLQVAESITEMGSGCFFHGKMETLECIGQILQIYDNANQTY